MLRSLKSLAFGLLLGFSIAVLALLLIYAVPEYIRPYFSAEAIYESQNFIFHYLKNSQVSKEIKAYAVAREEDLADILKALSLKLDAIPGKIHVFIHNGPAEMKGSIVRRKSAESTEIYLVVIDSFYGEDPPAQLVELVTYFGLGLPASRILKSGLEAYLKNPEDYYTQAAALPQQSFFTFQELIKLEAHGSFPQTLYEAFNSPKAKASLDLGLLSTLIKSDADISESEYQYPSPQILQAESAALVKYLIEELGGIEQFKKLWAAKSLEDGVKVYGLTLEELDEKWQSFLQEKRKDSALYNYLRGKNLASLGRYSEAIDLLKRALNTYPESGLILGSIYINLGKWEEAATSLYEALELGVPKDAVSNLLQLVEGYSRWATYETEDLLLHYPQDSPIADIKSFAEESGEIFKNIREKLQVAREALPEKIVIFIYNDEAQARKVLGQDFKSWTDPLAGVIHLKYNQAVGYELASVLSRNMLKPLTYSKVLQRGLAFYLDHSGRNYYKEAAALAASEAWIPLRNLDFDVYEAELVRIEAAAMVGFLLERYGLAKFKELWRKTSLIAEYKSLGSALEEIYGFSKEELEEKLLGFLKLKR